MSELESKQQERALELPAEESDVEEEKPNKSVLESPKGSSPEEKKVVEVG